MGELISGSSERRQSEVITFVILELALSWRVGLQLYTQNTDDDLLSSIGRSPTIVGGDNGLGTLAFIGLVGTFLDQDDEVVALDGGLELSAV